MTFRKIALATAISLALVGCGADDQPYEYLSHKPVDQISISDVTDNEVVAIEETDYHNAYEIPFDGIWILSHTVGDVTRYSSARPFENDWLGGERLMRLKFTEEGLVGHLLDGDVVFEGEVSRFEAAHNNPKIFKIPGEYNAYECATNDYNECTNKEKEVTNSDVPWYEKTHFAPSFSDIEVTAQQILFDYRLHSIIDTQVSYADFNLKDGVVNIELTHDLINRAGEPEKATVFYSLMRLDVVASKGYKPVHYDLDEHNKFGLFKTEYEKLNNIYVENQQGYQGYLIHRFDPRKERIEYYLSDEFFRKDEDGNLVNQMWIDATVKGFEYINASLEDKFSPTGRLVPELVLVNKDSTEPSGVKVGDIRKNTIHVITEYSNSSLLGYGPSIVNPFTGEIISARTIMYPGVGTTGVSRQWDDFVRLFNKGEIAAPLDQEPSQVASPINESREFGAFADLVLENETFTQFSASLKADRLQDTIEEEMVLSKPHEPVLTQPEMTLSQEENAKRIEQLINNNMYPVEMSGLSSSFVSEKTNIFDLDFYEEGMLVDPTAPETERKLKEWDDLTETQQVAIRDAIIVHQYQSTLVHEVGHNLGLRHNFSGSFDSKNFYSNKRSKELGLKGVPATASIMDYTPSELDIHPAYGMYDRAALRFAYQRSVAVHPKVDPNTQTQEEILAITRSETPEFRSLHAADEAKRQDLSNLSGLTALLEGQDLVESGLQLKDYLFCTDGKGHYNLETGCRVWDEGITVEEITDNVIERYRNRWELINERENRFEFNGTKRSIDKYNYLSGQYSRMNMVIDDYYKAHRDTHKTPAEACAYNVTIADKETCELTRAAYKQAHFYLDILKQPEMTCRIQMKQSIKAPGSNEYLEQATFSTDWALANLDSIAGLISGSVYRAKNNMPKSCFDEDFIQAIQSGSWYLNFRGDDLKIDFVSIDAETKHGNFFNIFSTVGTESQEDASRMGYERDSLGIWQEKLQAIQSLVEPSGLRGVDLSLADLPGIREELMGLIDHWALNKPLPAPSEIALEFSSAPYPYLMVDRNGTATENQTFTMNWSDTEIHSVPGILGWYFNGWYGTNFDGSTTSSRAFLYTLAKWDSRFTDRYKPNAFEMRRYLSLNEFDGSLPSGAEKISVLGKEYYALPSNTLAYNAIQTIKSSSAYQITQYSRAQLAASLTQRQALEEAVLTSVSDQPEVIASLRSSDYLAVFKSQPKGMELFIKEILAQFKARPTEGAENKHAVDALEVLFASGDVYPDPANGCFALVEAGCMMSFEGQFPSPVVALILATFDMHRATPELADLMPVYVDEYHKQITSVDAIFTLDNAEVVTYLNSVIGHEAKLQQVIDESGLLNLVVIDANDEVTTF